MDWLDHVRRDVRFGARGLLRTPGFTLLAVASLSLGIMATTAIYSVLHAVVLDPFPYKDVERLSSVRLSNAAARGSRTNYTIDQFLEMSERSRIFDGVIASTISDVTWTGDGDPQRLRGNHGTFNTFDVMGVPALVGRTPNADDAGPGAEPVVVLGYRFWQRQFGGDMGVVGRQLRLNDTTRTVIGVMPKRFMWRGADVYLPTRFERGQTVEGVRSVHLLGRLKPGVTAAQAEADLAPIITDLKAKEPTLFPDQWRVGILPFTEAFPSAIARDIWILLGAVGLLLLIACANVSNLLLSRASSRQREITVRAALGASRGRIVSQLLTESVLLAIVAGAIGAGLAYAGLPALLALVPPNTIPDEAEIALNTPVLLFTLGVCAITSILCGLAPALHSSRRDFAVAMRESGRGLAGGSRQAIVRRGLVVLEVALALVLMAGSSVLLRAFIRMQDADLPAPPEQVLVMRVPLPAPRYPDTERRNAFFQELIDRIQAVPGVSAAGVNTSVHPLGNMSMPVVLPGEVPSQEPVLVQMTSADYASALGMRLASGRLLSSSDVRGGQAVALVNQRFVRMRLEGREPLGMPVQLPRLKEPPLGASQDTFQIVGVLHDVPNEGLSQPIAPEIHVPFTTTGRANIVAVRLDGDPAAATRSIVGQVYSMDRAQPVSDLMTLDRLLDEYEYATPRFNLILLSIFAATGLILSIVGVYGVMSSAVAQERPEIGIRMALGASARTIKWMIVSRGLRLLLVGTVVGLVGSYAVGRWLAGEVWNVAAFDPVAFLGVSLLLLLAGVQACFWPARRAARTDPLIALRQD
jgi:predicted permease